MLWHTQFGSYLVVQNEYRRFYGVEPPTKQSIHYWTKQFKEAGSLLRRKCSGRPCTTQQNVDQIREKFERSPKTSTSRAGIQQGICQSTV